MTQPGPPDVVVTGTGRSGTSTVARILHTRLGVCMGHVFRDATPWSPRGDYEDSRFQKAARNAIGFPELHDKITDHRFLWMCATYDVIHKPSCSPHGVKSPHLSGLTPGFWQQFAPKLIVLCTRPKEPTVASMNKWRGSKHSWARFYNERTTMVRTAQASGIAMKEISFEYPLTDEQVEWQLRAMLVSAGLKHLPDSTQKSATST